MRVAFLVGETFPSLSKTFIINQITGLVDRGHEVDIYANFPDSQQLAHEDVIKYRLAKHTYYERVPKNKYERFFKTPQLLLKHFGRHPRVILRSLNGKKYGKQATSLVLLHQAIPHLDKQPYDIVHCHFGFLGVKSILLRDLGLLKGKLVVSFHGMDMTRYLQEEGDLVYRELFQQGDLFLPISNHWRKKLIALGCPPDKIRVHRMGIDPSSFSFVDRSHHSNCLQLVSVCRLVEKKGIEYAIKAIAELRDRGHGIKYQIIGDGELKPQLEQLTQELNLANYVTFLGSQPKSRVIEALNNVDALIAPSITARDGDCEGIPVALMEAMATGLPVISTWHSGIPELVENGIAGLLVAEKDIKGLAAKILYLQEHPEMRSRLGKAAATQIKEHYNINLLSDRLETIYGELATNLKLPQATNNEQSKIKNQRSTINHQPSTTNHQQPTNNQQQLTINQQQLTINQQQLTINHQQPTNNHQPTVSIIIPVYNDLERLHKCLQALEKQTYPAELYEIIVVDNGSKQSIAPEIASYPHAIATTEVLPGSYIARNRGISLAKGKVIAFTDADCIPQPNWLLDGVQTLLSNSEYGIVGGKVALFYRNSTSLTAVEMYESLHAFPQQENILQDRFTVTANLFTYKHLFQEIGGFDPQLKSNGDREWCHRVSQKGYQLAYAENAVVLHPARYSLTEMYRKHLRIVGGQEQIKLLQPSNIKVNLLLKIANIWDADLIFGFLPPIKYCWRILSLKDKYSLINKFKIISVLSILKYGGQLEKIKIRMGSLAQR